MALMATFSVAGTRFAVPAALVQEVVHAARVTPVPRAPSPLSGLVNLRGRILPVYSLSERLGLGEDRGTIAVVLDVAEPLAVSVEGYHDVLDPDGVPRSGAPSTLDPEVARCVAGVWMLDGTLVCELDLDAALGLRPA